MTIKITLYGTRPDAAEDAVEQFDCSTVAEAMSKFDTSHDSAVVRCETDLEFYGVMAGVRRFNDPIGEAALKDAEPGVAVEGVKMWHCTSQGFDGPGWRLVFAFQVTPLKKPKLPPPVPVEKGSALGPQKAEGASA